MVHGHITRLADIFKAFADPTRLRMIRLLASNMESRLTVQGLAKKLQISQPATSQHLRVLKNIGILEAKNDRPRIYYYLNLPELKKQKILMDEMYEYAFTRCDREGQCQDCPFRDNCDEMKTA